MEQQDAFSANLFKWDLPQRGVQISTGSVPNPSATSSTPPLRLLEAMAAAAAAAAGGAHHHHHHQASQLMNSSNAYQQQVSSYGGVGSGGGGGGGNAGGAGMMNMNMMMMNNNHHLQMMNGNSTGFNLGAGVRGGSTSSSVVVPGTGNPTMNLMNMNAMMIAAARGGGDQQILQQQMGMGGLEELFQPYGVRHYTAAKIAELGFTVSTLVDMRDEELDDMMTSLAHLFRWDLLVGERYGIKAAVRAERRRLEEIEETRRRGGGGGGNGCLMISGSGGGGGCINNNPSSGTNEDTAGGPDHHHQHHVLDAFSQQEISEERMQQNEREVVGSGGGTWEMVTAAGGVDGHQEDMMMMRKKQKQKQTQKKQQLTQNSSRGGGGGGSGRKKSSIEVVAVEDDQDEVDDEEEDGSCGGGGGGGERQREHPFIVTEPGEVARGKKNGLDYLFHLYELCREFLIQVQNLAKERGDKCPTKVTNQVFRYAKKAGATYINKPKMRHYVHCYALHCLDEETSNALRRAYKERGENVGAWRQACYKPLVAIASRQGWDVDAIFNQHPRLCIWYVPTKLRQLCHTERRAAATATAVSGSSLAANSTTSSHHQLSHF